MQDTVRIGRRAFLQGSTLLLTAGLKLSAVEGLLAGEEDASALQFGLITDIHYADKPPAGTRYYRESLTKLAEAAAEFDRAQPAFVVELGDLIDAAESVDVEQSYLERIQREFVKLARERHCVLGNHCVDTLTKSEFLKGVGQDRSYYAFERDGWHFVVLDACFRADGQSYGRKNSHWTDANLPREELRWLADDLARNRAQTIVFAHQRLDESGPHMVKNAAEVRTLLEQSGNVVAVFQGHSHQNDYQEIAGIHYCTLAAMIEGTGPENSSYALASLATDGAIRLRGFRRQKAYAWDVDCS